jgi:signal transduction histidine kinase
MTVRFKIALTIFLTGLLTAVGVIATVLFAFQRFEHEAIYYRASGFLERVTARHPDMFDMQERFQDDFNGFLSNLVLFEPDTQLYLLDSAGALLASSSEKQFPKGFKVALGPVLEASGPEPMPYVLGDDPQRMTTASVVAARALHRTVIRNAPVADGYLYLVYQKETLPQGRLTALQSTFAQPTLVSILAVVALSTLLAAWVIAAVTRPLQRLSRTVAAVTRYGLEDTSTPPGAAPPGTFGLVQTTSKDEFGQLTNGIHTMLTALQTQWSMLRRLDHFRREGISNLSHDLRSPLTATTACLETLDTRWADNAQRTDDRKLVEVALRNTRNAARLVQSLGDLAQLDEPKFQLNTEVMDVSELLDDVALRFAERAARQGVHIQACPLPQIQHDGPHVVAAPADTPTLAAVDVELFERAIANLVDNALKFCSTGTRITLDAVRVGAEVLVSVSDTGPGIASADIPNLFDRFYQSRQSVAPATGEGGKGLGLAIVKRIVELHGGQVQVHSQVGSGTQVVVHLPAAMQ